MSRSAHFYVTPNDLSSIFERSKRCSSSELVFGWPVSDAVAEILERVEVADAKFVAKASFDRNVNTQDRGCIESLVCDEVRHPEVQTTFELTNIQIRRSLMDSMTTEHSIRIADSVRETINQDGAVLLDIKQGLCFSLNPVGAKIWEMLKSEHSLDQIANALSQEFQVPRAQIEADIAEFLDGLRKRNLIQAGNEQNSSRRSWFARLFS